MLSISDLLSDNRLTANYFASDVYVRGLLEMGLLENRRGNRLLALPESLIKGIYAGLEQETGQASTLVLYNCGKWWGKNFYARFCEELTDYYGQAFAEMPMAEFTQALQQCWCTHGWGKLSLDVTYRSQGFLVVEIHHSLFAKLASNLNRPACFLETGILQSFFSQLTGRDLFCLQTTCESMGQPSNQFILGLEKRLKSAEVMVEQRRSHADIMEALIRES
jgi:uncharacterized protein